MGGKGGVITAAVLCVKNQADVQKLGFQRGEAGVGPQAVENIFGCREGRIGIVQDQRPVLVVMLVDLVAVDRQEREVGDQLQALAQNIDRRGLVRVGVIGIEG